MEVRVCAPLSIRDAATRMPVRSIHGDARLLYCPGSVVHCDTSLYHLRHLPASRATFSRAKKNLATIPVLRPATMAIKTPISDLLPVGIMGILAAQGALPQSPQILAIKQEWSFCEAQGSLEVPKAAGPPTHTSYSPQREPLTCAVTNYCAPS